jgi:hypothetical protein
LNEQLAMEKLTGAVATGQISVEQFGQIVDAAMADGVISIGEVNKALEDIPSDIPVNVSVTTTGMESALYGLSSLGASLSKQAISNPGRTYAQGGRAGGGFVTAGASYIVGEKGIEEFTPSTNGNITSNSEMNSGIQLAALVGAIPSARDNAKALARELMKMGVGSR